MIKQKTKNKIVVTSLSKLNIKIAKGTQKGSSSENEYETEMLA